MRGLALILTLVLVPTLAVASESFDGHFVNTSLGTTCVMIQPQHLAARDSTDGCEFDMTGAHRVGITLRDATSANAVFIWTLTGESCVTRAGYASGVIGLDVENCTSLIILPDLGAPVGTISIAPS